MLRGLHPIVPTRGDLLTSSLSCICVIVHACKGSPFSRRDGGGQTDVSTNQSLWRMRALPPLCTPGKKTSAVTGSLDRPPTPLFLPLSILFISRSLPLSLSPGNPSGVVSDIAAV